MSEIHNAPQTRQAWLDLTANNREVRGKTDGGGGVELYGSKRGLLGQALAFIKDPLFAQQRATKREAAAAALQDFIGRSHGLSREQVQDAFTRAGVVAGQPLKRAALERVFAEVDRVGQAPQDQGNAPPRLTVVPTHVPIAPPPLDNPNAPLLLDRAQPITTPTFLQHEEAPLIEVPPTVPVHTARPRDVPLSRGRIDVSGVEAPARQEMVESHGVLGPKLLLEMIKNRLVDLGIDPKDPTLEVKELTSGQGAQSMSLLRVIVGGKMVFAVKDSGTKMETPDLGLMFGGYTKGRDGVYSDPGSFEDKRLKTVEDSVLGRMGTLDGLHNVRVGIAQTEATFRYVPPERYTAVTPEGEFFHNQRVEHQISVLRAAPGEKGDKIFDRDDLQEMSRTTATLARALGAMHAHYASDVRMPDGGLRTLIHGDFHPANMFVDGNTVTLIDLAGASSNFDHHPPGHDMLRDVQRTLAQGALSTAARAHPELRKVFLEAYAENFAHIRGPDGQPQFTADKIDELLKATRLDERGRPVLKISSEPIT